MAWRFLRRRRRDEELARELEAHLAHETESQLARGVGADEARFSAARKLGNRTTVRETVYERSTIRPLESIWQDVRYALRMLRLSPGFAAMAIASLALGIGATTAMFSLVHHLLIKPLPYPDPDRLMILTEINPRHRPISISYPNFVDWRKQSTSWSSFAGVVRTPMSLTGVAVPAQLIGRMASASFFEVFGVQPILGRTYTAEEDSNGGQSVVVLSYSTWQQHFAGDPDVLGKTISLNLTPATVIGVLPASFDYYRGSAEFYVPLSLIEQRDSARFRGNHSGLTAFARLKAGVSFAQADAEMKTIVANLERQYPETNSGNSIEITPLPASVTGGLKPTVLMLFGAVSFVLLIACANVANLLLARMTVRQKEITVRAALGASRWRIVRQLLAECAVLSSTAGVLGTLLAVWVVSAIRSFLPGAYGILRDAEVRLPVLGFALLAAIASAFFFGLIPARHATQPGLLEGLHATTRSSSGSKRTLVVRRLLLVSEVALAVVLAVGATLLTRSLQNALNVDIGFRSENLLTAQVRLPTQKYNGTASVSFFDRLQEAMENAPGVQGMTMAGCLPIDGSCWGSVFIIANKPVPDRARLLNSAFNVVSRNYFETMGIRLVKGRSFMHGDTGTSTPVVVINESAAKRFFPNEDPIGQRIKDGFPEDQTPWREIVGVVADVKQNGPTAEQLPEMFLSLQQEPETAMWPIIRTAVPPETLTGSLRDMLRNLDPDVPLSNVRTMEWRLSTSVATRRFTLALVGVFTGVAVLMAVIGVFGVIAYLVSQRTREIGVRMALGARQSQILGSVVGEGARIGAAGVLTGLVASVGLMRLIEALLFGVSPFDPLTFLIVAIGVAAVTVLACLIPARNASRINPVNALRHE